MTVETLDVYGSDMKISKYAGISYGKENESKNRLSVLIKNEHESPFRLAGLVLKMKLPLFVFRQIQRTEVGRDFLEKSYRYVHASEMPFYIPKKYSNVAQNIILTQYKNAIESYKYLINNENLPKEVARTVLPMGVYVEVIGYWSLSALIRLYKSRTLNKHAQEETRDFVQLMWNEVSDAFPIVAEEIEIKYKKER